MAMTKNNDLLNNRIAKVLPTKDALAKLMQKRKIKIYLGIDPTGSHLHLGHAVALRKLMEFAEAGHEVIFLFGTGTVLVGDPSLRASARIEISQSEINKNIQDWKSQAAKIIDFSKVDIRKNGDWLKKLKLEDIIKISSNISAVQLFKRESFQRRLDKGDTVWYHETMYPLLQGYDSVAMNVDAEIGGTDQEFNMLIGRELVKKIQQKEKFIIVTPMILGTDGKTMSKSSGNCIWLDDAAGEMYGKLMALKDELIESYFELCTNVSEDELATAKKSLKKSKNPREIKAQMAYEVTRIYHGDKAAKQAAAEFDAQFKDHKVPSNIPTIKLSKSNLDLVDVLAEAGLATSKSHARRLISQGGVQINGKQPRAENSKVKSKDIIRVGKRNYRRIT